MNRTEMRKRYRNWSIGIAVLIGMGFFPRAMLYAQEKKVERGRLTIGIRQLAGNRGSSKFTEYRDIPRGLFIQNFDLNLDNLFRNNFFLNFQTRETLEKDQAYLLSLGMYGKYRLEVRWDQTPHLFTNTAKSFLLASSPGVFTVPAPIRSNLQTRPGDVPVLLAGAAPLGVSLRRHSGSGRFIYTPTAAWNLQLQYSREKQIGVRPFGTTTNAFSHMVELPEPIDYRTHQVKASAEYSNEIWGIQVSHGSSIFKNDVGQLLWDNPFVVTDAVGTAARGRLDLYPGNKAQSLSIAGAFDIGKSTRLVASIVPGWMRQNDPFLPFTINPALTGLPQLPASSLNGKKQTLAMNYTLTNASIPALTLTARYRSYDYDNNTPSFIFSDYVRTDASLVGMARKNLPYAYNRQNLGVDGSWEFWKGHFLKLGYEWERFDRDYRDVERANEHTVGAALDVNPKQWLLWRASYKHGERQPKHYEPNEASFPLGEGLFALGQLHELRKFDEAARGRDRAETLLQIDPIDALSFSASYGTTQDHYKESLYGLLKDINYNFSFDLTYSPRSELSVFAEFTRERYKYNQRSRQRVPRTPTAPANDSPNNDWESHMRDLIDTWGAGLYASVLNSRVTAEAFYSFSLAKGSIRTRTLGSASIPGFLVTTAQDYPNTSNRFHQVVTSIKLRVRDNLYPRFEYRLEDYGRMDFQIDRISPYMFAVDAGTRTSVFLGADVPGYRAHIIAVGLEYRF